MLGAEDAVEKGRLTNESGDVNAGENGGGDYAGHARPHGKGQNHGFFIDRGGAFLGYFGRGRYAGNSGDADQWIERLFGKFAIDKAADDATQAGKSEGNDAQDEQNQYLGVQDDVNAEESAQREAEEEGGAVQQWAGEEFNQSQNACLLDGQADEKGSEKRGRHREEGAEEGAGDDGESEFRPR